MIPPIEIIATWRDLNARLNAIASDMRSEIRHCRFGDRKILVVEKVGVVLGAAEFDDGFSFPAPPALQRVPGHRESARIVDRNERLQDSSVLQHPEPLH